MTVFAKALEAWRAHWETHAEGWLALAHATTGVH